MVKCVKVELRMVYFGLTGLGLVIFSIALGMWGYMKFEHMSGLDALTNSCMLLGGMGPLAAPATVGGKLFASFYSLYSGFFVLLVLAILVGPLFHKVIDYFHLHDGMPESDK
ncbi:MAG: hypothetical protein K2X86_09540 [Cytophagaceae bacterium]|nr:hypothetical protein [Cytophagaceae bacterium]